MEVEQVRPIQLLHMIQIRRIKVTGIFILYPKEDIKMEATNTSG